MKTNIMNRIKRRGRQQIIIMSIVFPLFFIWSLSLIFPILWAFINSFKTPNAYFDNSFALPGAGEWQFSNWAEAFTSLEVYKSNPLYKATFVEMIFNSIWYTLVGAFINLITVSMFAYVVSKYKFKLKKFLFGLSVAVMMIPIVGALPAQYQLYGTLRINNSPLMLITSVGGVGGATFLIMYSYFKSISWSYAESVFIDGGGNWTVFLKIMLPQAAPILVAMYITVCISRWNDFMTPLIYLGDYPTLATGLYKMQTSSLTTHNKPMFFAAVLISTIPIFILFIAFSNKIMNNISFGGIKG